MRLFKVGGCVRDKILGRDSKDVDFAVEAPSFAAMRQGILDMGGEIFLESPEYLTIRAKTPQYGATDFVLCRKDGEYRDGRRPESVEAGTIDDDLARRDFTMNAIAQCPETGEIVDPFDGRRAIEIKQIICVGNTEKRFEEDALRVFRAIRFSVVLGFDISPKITEVIRAENINYENVSTERIREELFKACKVDSWLTFSHVCGHNLHPLVEERGIWFKPTVEKR